MTEEYDNEAIEHLLNCIHKKYGYDFSHYSAAFIKRRIRHNMSLNNISSLSELEQIIVSNDQVEAIHHHKGQRFLGGIHICHHATGKMVEKNLLHHITDKGMLINDQKLRTSHRENTQAL